MKTMEMESCLNQLPSELELINDFPNTLSRLLEDISSFDLKYRNSYLGGNIQCNNCKIKFSIGLFDTIHIENGSSVENTQDIGTLVEKVITRSHQNVSKNCEQLEANVNDKKLIIITINGDNQISFSSKIKIMGPIF